MDQFEFTKVFYEKYSVLKEGDDQNPFFMLNEAKLFLDEENQSHDLANKKNQWLVAGIAVYLSYLTPIAIRDFHNSSLTTYSCLFLIASLSTGIYPLISFLKHQKSRGFSVKGSIPSDFFVDDGVYLSLNHKEFVLMELLTYQERIVTNQSITKDLLKRYNSKVRFLAASLLLGLIYLLTNEGSSFFKATSL